MDRQTAVALDSYLTREPPWRDDERPVFRCGGCGRFLRDEPDGRREWAEIRRCDGQPKVLDCAYGESSHDEQILAIIGEQFRGQRYKLAYPPACGTRDGGGGYDGDHEISVSEAEEYRHEPHFYAEGWGYVAADIRTCVCGFANEEVQF